MYLVIQLAPSLLLDVRKNDSPGSISFEGTALQEVEAPSDAGLFLGFYDWLRTSDGRVVGVELTFHDHRDAIQHVLETVSVGRWIAPDIFRVLFDELAQVDDDASVDQEFSVSRCYKGPDGRVALLLDAAEVAKEDLDALIR